MSDPDDIDALHATWKAARCSVDGCERPHHARNWCRMHYHRWRRSGDPFGERTPVGEPMAYLLSVLTTMPTECTTWPYGTDSSGYGALHCDGEQRGVHVLVCEWYHGPRPPGLECCHSCHNGHLGCFTPSHLRWDTHEANNQERSRLARGECHPQSKLTAVQVAEIRARYAIGGTTRQALGAAYGVAPTTIADIITGRRWTQEAHHGC